MGGSCGIHASPTPREPPRTDTSPPPAEPLPHGSKNPENASFPPGCCMTPSQLRGALGGGGFNLYQHLRAPSPAASHWQSLTPARGFLVWAGGWHRELPLFSTRGGPGSLGSVPRVPRCERCRGRGSRGQPRYTHRSCPRGTARVCPHSPRVCHGSAALTSSTVSPRVTSCHPVSSVPWGPARAPPAPGCKRG